MSKESFLYQINFNRKKYPEICEALEEAKLDLGVAWYLRELIQKDIEERKIGAINSAPVFKPMAEAPQNVRAELPKKTQKPKTTKSTSIELPDDSGGFM